MEENSLKSVLFGGFDRQSVIDTIDKMTKESTKVKESLQTENQKLTQENRILHTRLAETEENLRILEEEKRAVSASLAECETMCAQFREEAERLRPEWAQFAAELEKLRPEAEAYAQVKSHIGDIECAARKRADELNASVNAKLSALLRDFRREYQELVQTFAVTATHVLGELRKVEVNLTQLPHTFDKMSTELDELEKVLGKD